MSTILEQLLVLQERDQKLSKLNRELEDIPARQQDIEAKLDGHKEALRAVQEDQKKKAATMKEIEGEIEARKQKIGKFREQQFQIKSNVEYKALEHEIAVVQKEISGLEDREIELMEQMEEMKKVIASREQDLKEEQAKVNDEVVILRKRTEQIEAEMAALRSERQTLVVGIPADWLARYEKIFQRRQGDNAIARIEHGACGGCHMKLPPQVVHDTKKSLSIMHCSFCGRMLYLPP